MQKPETENPPSRDRKNAQESLEKRILRLEERVAVLEKKAGIKPKRPRSNKPSVRQLIIRLKNDGLLKKPCSLRDISDQLDALSFPTKTRNMTRPLRSLVQDGLLFKRRDETGHWRYFSDPPAGSAPPGDNSC